MYSVVFAVLVAACVLANFARRAGEISKCTPVDGAGAAAHAPTRTPAFMSFQANYVLVYLLAVAADWLQGPYVYALYTEYGFSKKQIGQLFIAGFGSSAVFGTFVGSIADKFGRKANVVVYALTYGISCATKHSPVFRVLMIGRLFAGVATSILFSAFESWLVSEHNTRGYDPALLSDTFSKAQFGNAVVAIVAGQVAGVAASLFGKVAPFDTSAVVLGMLALIVLTTWTENYGDQCQSVSGGLSAAWSQLLTDAKIINVGTVQSCFESAMYLMVFSWTPVLQHASDVTGAGEIPHGMIFSSFMVSIMLGSTLFNIFLKYQPVELFLRNLFVMASGCFVVVAWSNNLFLVYVSLLIFEVVCGVYFPAMGTLRAKYVPEETRSAIMNFLRVPLNVIVCATLYMNLSNSVVFQLSTVLVAIAVLSQHRLSLLSKPAFRSQTNVSKEDMQEPLFTQETAGQAAM